MNKNSYEVDVLVNGKAVKNYTHQGNTYIEAKNGTEYSIKIKNNQSRRVLAVISVDGVNVISGDPAGVDGAGYIINGHSAFVVQGFRNDENTVGSFKFCSKDRSYSKQVGLKNNQGVIGVKIIQEVYTPEYELLNIKGMFNQYPVPNITYCANNSSVLRSKGWEGEVCCSSLSDTRSLLDTSTSSDVSLDLGTTWGKKITDKVVTEEFNRSTIVTDMVIYYASRKVLEEIGIVFVEEKKINLPSAFPKFASPPPYWK